MVLNPSSRLKEIDDVWIALCNDPAGFLKNRNPLEDETIECKASVFTEPFYDEVKKDNAEKFTPSGKFLHINLFHAIEAIAGMANSRGGIVISGVASARLDAFPDNGFPLGEKGMKGDDLKTKYMRRERGLRLGKALVIGLDDVLPQFKHSGPADAQHDKLTQKIFGRNSPLWGDQVGDTLSLHEFNDWFTFVPEDASDADTYPSVNRTLWKRLRWSDSYGSHLCNGARLLPVADGTGQTKWIAAIKVGFAGSLIYYIEGKNQSGSDTVTVPFHFPCQIKRYRFQDRAALQTLAGRFRQDIFSPSELFGGVASSSTGTPWDLDDLRTIADKQSEDYLDKMQSERIYLPHLYVRRFDLETHLQGFLDQQCTKTGMLIVGPSGIGKTNTLCHIVRQWHRHEQKTGSDIVLLMGGSTLPGGNFDLRDIILDRLESADDFLTFCTILEGHLQSLQAQFILIVDGVDKHPQPSELLRQLDDLIAHTQDFPGFKVIISIGEVTYKSIRKGSFAQAMHHYYSVRLKEGMQSGESPEVYLGRLADDELSIAYENYRKEPGHNPTSEFKALTDEVKNVMRTPLFLKIIMEIFNGRPLPRRVLTAEVLLEYCNRKVFNESNRTFFINRFVDLLYANKWSTAKFDDLAQSEELRHILLDSTPQSSYIQLLDEQILVEQFKRVSSVLPPQRIVGFAYDRLLEYMLLMRIVDRFGVSTEVIKQLSDEAYAYLPLQGVLSTLFLAWVDEGKCDEVVSFLLAGTKEIMKPVALELLTELELMNPTTAAVTESEMEQSPVFRVISLILADPNEWTKHLLLEYCDVLQGLGFYHRAVFIYTKLHAILDLTTEDTLVAHLYHGLGKARIGIGEFREALDILNKALKCYQAAGDKSGEQAALDSLGRVYTYLGDMHTAKTHFLQSLKIDRELLESDSSVTVRRGEAESLYNLSEVCFRTGDSHSAIDFAEQARRIYADINDQNNMAAALTQAGKLYRRQGLGEKARHFHQEALLIHRRNGCKRGAARDLLTLGLTYEFQGEWAEAVSYYEDALTVFQEIGDRFGVADACTAMGEVYRWQEKYNDAVTAYNRALSLYREMDSTRGIVMCLHNLGAAFLFAGDTGKALDFFKQTRAIKDEQKSVDEEPECLAYLSYALFLSGDTEDAINYSDRAVSILQQKYYSEQDVQLVHFYGSST